MLDMIPISMGIADGKMFNMGGSTITTNNFRSSWGGNNLFGMIYHVPDNQFYLRKLDAFYNCSLSALYRNHTKDNNHRAQIEVIPILPKSLDSLSRHTYELNNPIKAWAWMANIDLPSVSRRINRDCNRVRPGCNVEAVKEAFQFLK